MLLAIIYITPHGHQLEAMMEEQQPQKRCLWHAADGRCSNCKARRIRSDVLKIKEYEMCGGESYYGSCEFYTPKPEPKK